MHAFSPDANKQRLLGILRDAEAADAAVVDKGLQFVEVAKASIEVNRELRNVITQMPSDAVLDTQSWARMTSGWESHKDASKALFSVFVSSTHTSSTSATASLGTTLAFTTAMPWMNEPSVKPHLAALDSTLHRAAKVADARLQLQTFGLNAALTGLRSPLALLNEAEAARTRPSTGQSQPTSILLPLRECIESSLAALLRRVPNQSPTGKTAAKVELIGSQCGKSGLAAYHFHNLGIDCGNLIKDLSGAKQADLPEKRTNSLYDAGVLFIIGFLSSLEVSKLKP